MSYREKVMVIGGSVLLSLFLLYQLDFAPNLKKIKILDRSISQKEKQLEELKKLSFTYLGLKEKKDSFQEKLIYREKDFSLPSHLEKLAGTSGIKANIQAMKPSISSLSKLYQEQVVEIKLEGVNLPQLTKYLYEIQKSPQLLRIKRLYIKPRYTSPFYLEASLQVAAYRVK